MPRKTKENTSRNTGNRQGLSSSRQSLRSNDLKHSLRSQSDLKQRTKRVCLFCTEKITPSYTDTVSLRKFLSTRGKIVPKLRSGMCSKHQRALTREVKHARHLALLPFTLRV